MRVGIRTTPQAEAQALAAAAWWRRNRPAAPDLFTNELAGAFDLLARAPEIGHRFRHSRVPGVRRLMLPGTRYHVYYVYDEEGSECVILAVWSAVRGRAPRLRRP